MRRIAPLLFFVTFALAACALFLLFEPLRSNEVFVDLPAGTSARSMAGELQAAGVIRSRYGFLLLRLVRRGSLKAGEYRFAGESSTAEFYERIRKGDVYTRAVAIPEGFNLFDIARAVDQAGLAPADTFIAASRSNVDLVATWAPQATSLEGFLYPDTYRFSRHLSVRGMQEMMVKRFRTAAVKLALTTNVLRTVTLASLIEKEVRFDDERRMAAGVFSNRLARGMPLQTDPSVIYAAQLAGRWTGVIHRSDLQFGSPYNTYLHSGLPPAPICSPGEAALTAALHPLVTDNFYFVADANGHTLFSATLKEHAAKVAAYRSSALTTP